MSTVMGNKIIMELEISIVWWLCAIAAVVANHNTYITVPNT